MRSPKLPDALTLALFTGIFLALAAPGSTPVTADPPDRVDTVVPDGARLSTYEHLLHAEPPGYADPSGATSRDSWDVEHYRVVIIPDFTDRSIQGFVEIHLRSLENGLQSVELDLYDDFLIGNIHTGSGNLTYVHSGDLLRVNLSDPLGAGERATITISYSGTPQPAGPLGLAFDTTPGGRPILATISEPFYARSWWPCKDTTLDKATVELQAIVPANMFVASSGTLQSVVDVGSKKAYTWASNYPMTTYNVNLAVTEYVSWIEEYTSPEGITFPLEFHVFPEHEQIARYEFERVPEMIDFFSELYGPYAFSEEKYGMAEVVLAGAMEHQTMTSYGDFFMTGDRYYEGIVAHELSHHWWGNLITLEDWDDLWLHEGLATFSDALWREHIDGREAYLNFLAQRAKNCCGFNGPISPPDKLFNETVYQKGAWMFHMLREWLGDDDFFGALRSITANPEFRFGHFGESEFVSAIESHTGRDLTWFFDQWLHREGRPDIAIEWVPVPGSSADPEIRIRVHQVQSEAVWYFPLRVRVHMPSGPADHDFFSGTRLAEFVVKVSEWPTSIEIDPDRQLLHFDSGSVRVTDTPATRSGATRLLPNWPNPFNPRTSLRFSLAETADVRLRIYDLRGRVTRTLDCGTLGPGDHERLWDGNDDRGNSVASGNYLVRLEGAATTPPARTVTLVR